MDRAALTFGDPAALDAGAVRGLVAYLRSIGATDGWISRHTGVGSLLLHETRMSGVTDGQGVNWR